MTGGWRIISSASHAVEPWELWQTRVEEAA